MAKTALNDDDFDESGDEMVPPTPTTDDIKEVELTVVHRVGDGTPGPGRRLYLNPRRFIRICHLIEDGASASGACRQEGVTYPNFRRRVMRFPSWQRRLKDAEFVREHWMTEFHIGNILHHAPRNVITSLWWLERTNPAKYALRKVDRNESAEAMVGDRIPADRLAEYGRFMLELAEEQKAKELKAKSEEQLPPESASA